MLDYLEQEASARRVDLLVLLTTRSADWFEQRGFVHGGAAAGARVLPEARRAKVNAARNSQLYTKALDMSSTDDDLAPGKRIGIS